MKRAVIALLAGLMLGLPAHKASAQDQFGERSAVTIDPARAYIFFRAPRKMGLLFLRTPNEADRAAHETARAAAFAQARREFERRRMICRGAPTAFQCRRFSEETAPTEENFAFPPVTLERNFAGAGRNPPFTKEEGRTYTYLIAVTPGTYTFFGQMDLTATGVFGVCLCMGSLRFEAAAGRIVDLGTVTYPALEAIGANGAHGFAFTGLGPPSIAIVPAGEGASLPARLAGLPVVRAEFSAADKMPNYLHLYLDRHPALAGVLRYERDRVIDDRTGTGPVPPARAPGAP
jgi:hypothetical protein